MSLESLIAPAKWLDHQVLRQHNRFARAMESKGLEPVETANLVHYSGWLAFMAGIAGFYASAMSAPPPSDTPPEQATLSETLEVSGIISYMFGSIGTFAIANDLFIDDCTIQDPATEVGAIDRWTYISKKAGKAMRLPMLIASGAVMGDIIYHTAQGLPAGEALAYSSLVISTMAHTSSIYLRDHDPHLLDREPSNVARAYRWLMDKVPRAQGPVPQLIESD